MKTTLIQILETLLRKLRGPIEPGVWWIVQARNGAILCKTENEAKLATKMAQPPYELRRVVEAP